MLAGASKSPSGRNWREEIRTMWCNVMYWPWQTPMLLLLHLPAHHFPSPWFSANPDRPPFSLRIAFRSPLLHNRHYAYANILHNAFRTVYVYPREQLYELYMYMVEIHESYILINLSTKFLNSRIIWSCRAYLMIHKSSPEEKPCAYRRIILAEFYITFCVIIKDFLYEIFICTWATYEIRNGYNRMPAYIEILCIAWLL